MSANDKVNYYEISQFPKPFAFEKTPYSQFDFTEDVKNKCVSSVINEQRISKIIILGDVSVGKTSIVNKFCKQAYNSNYKATIGVDFEIEKFNILNVPFNMQIWDTAGQERFRCIAAAYYRSAHVIVTVFDLTNLKSLKHSLDWLREALKVNDKTPLKFLVGTKMDLLVKMSSAYVKVDEQASKIAKLMGAEYWAVSSKTGEGIKDLFFRIAALSFEQVIKCELEACDNFKPIILKQSLIS